MLADPHRLVDGYSSASRLERYPVPLGPSSILTDPQSSFEQKATDQHAPCIQHNSAVFPIHQHESDHKCLITTNPRSNGQIVIGGRSHDSAHSRRCPH